MLKLRTAYYVKIPMEDADEMSRWIRNYCTIISATKNETIKYVTIICVPRVIIGRLVFERDLRILKMTGKSVCWTTKKFQ